MGKLTIKKDGQFEREYPLERERTKIGRAPESDIQLDDPSVSSKHAIIFTLLDDSFVQDLDSTNGTLVSGDSIEKQELKDGDIIQIANWEMVYEKDEQDDSDIEETIVDDSEGEKTIMVQRGSVDKVENTSKFLLKLLSGPDAGKEFEMLKSVVKLGRPGKQLAVISRRPQGYFFTYVEGAGNEHPLINDESTGPDTRLLKNDDVIEMSGFKMQVIITD